MLYFVHTIYRSNYGDLRDQVLEPHRQHFDGNLDKVLAGGNLSTDDDSQRIGGVALLDMPDRRAVETFMAKDPFRGRPHHSTTIVRWNKIYFDRQSGLSSSNFPHVEITGRPRIEELNQLSDDHRALEQDLFRLRQSGLSSRLPEQFPSR